MVSGQPEPVVFTPKTRWKRRIARLVRPDPQRPRETSGPRIDRIPSTRPPWRDRQYRELKKIFFSPPTKCPIGLFGPLANRTILKRECMLSTLREGGLRQPELRRAASAFRNHETASPPRAHPPASARGQTIRALPWRTRNARLLRLGIKGAGPARTRAFPYSPTGGRFARGMRVKPRITGFSMACSLGRASSTTIAAPPRPHQQALVRVFNGGRPLSV